MSRREKIRQITIDEIKTLARRQMAEHGTAGISLNAIARQMDISGPALYRYFASREELITVLIVDSYQALGDCLEENARTNPHLSPRKRLDQMLLAYRRWALDHPVDFQLIFGNPIPGYHGPEELTQPVARRVFAPILRIIAEAYQTGNLRPPKEIADLPPGLQVLMEAFRNDPADQTPESVIYIGLVGWYHIHGMIMLELFHHTDPLISSTELFYRYELERFYDSLNLS